MIAPIILILLLLIIVISGFYVYFKYIRISDRIARKIEIIGYIFLVVLIVWTFFIKNVVMGNFYIQDSYYTAEKFKHLYSILINICYALNVDVSNINNFYSLENNKYLDQQLLTCDIIEAILQLISTIFIAIGRLQDLKRNKI